MRTIHACIAVVLGACLLPTTAGAATVSVTEESLSSFPAHERATLVFEAAPGEDNIATIAPAGEESGKVRYEVRDLHAPLTAGPGCTGGGGPDVPVTCLMSRSRAGNCPSVFTCNDRGRELVFRFTLGDGNDELRATQLPADDGGGGQITLEADGGSGDDQLYPGPTNDILDPGPGADTVRSNQGNDFVDAGDSPDGADHYDLREGVDAVSYADAGQPVSVTLDSEANDGAAGEGDAVIDAEAVTGTRGSDTLVGDDDGEQLMGNGGGDLLIGNGGNDGLSADARFVAGEPLVTPTPDRDVMRGGPGNDGLSPSQGDDLASGGAGDDHIFGADGADRVSGGKGADYVDGGGDADRLAGGSGRDRLDAGLAGDAGDGAADRLDCGRNVHDHAFNVERRDRVEGCERVKPGLS